MHYSVSISNVFPSAMYYTKFREHTKQGFRSPPPPSPVLSSWMLTDLYAHWAGLLFALTPRMLCLRKGGHKTCQALLSVTADARNADQLQQGRRTELTHTRKPKPVCFHCFVCWARCIQSSLHQHLRRLITATEILGLKVWKIRISGESSVRKKLLKSTKTRDLSIE